MGRKPLFTVAMSHAERTRRWREKHGLNKPAKPASVDAALAQELAQAKARNAELEALLAQRDAELARLRNERLAFRFGGKRSEPKPKAEKPPLPPDEERDRIIKGLRTRVRNLAAELQDVRLWAATRQGIMPRETRIAIDKALHPDSTPSEAERNRAVKGWNAWKNDNDKAQRRAR